MRKDTNQKLGRKDADALSIFVDSPKVVTTAVAALRDLGMSEVQIERYFRSRRMGGAPRLPEQTAYRGTSD